MAVEIPPLLAEVPVAGRVAAGTSHSPTNPFSHLIPRARLHRGRRDAALCAPLGLEGRSAHLATGSRPSALCAARVHSHTGEAPPRSQLRYDIKHGVHPSGRGRGNAPLPCVSLLCRSTCTEHVPREQAVIASADTSRPPVRRRIRCAQRGCTAMPGTRWKAQSQLQLRNDVERGVHQQARARSPHVAKARGWVGLGRGWGTALIWRSGGRADGPGSQRGP